MEQSPASPSRPVRDDRRRIQVLVFGFWTTMGLLESAKAYVTLRLRGAPGDWSGVLVGNMPWWWLWALATPMVFWLARRFRLDRDGRAAALAVHFVAALLLAAAHLAVAGVLFFYTRTRGVLYEDPLQQILGFFSSFYAVDLFTYAAVVGAFYVVEFHRRYRQEELAAAEAGLRAARLESLMSEARLNALRMELNPHFLFNTLNAVSGLVRRRDDAAAVRMLARLGDLLRATLDSGGDVLVPLERELELLDRYLEIERIRFHDRLRVVIDVEPEVRHALVPPLLLQPLVENAVRHGVARVPGPGTVTLRAQRDGGDLKLTVTDTGAGFANGAPVEEGVGLANTRARLEQLHGARARMVLENGSGGGARVTVVLPLQRGSDESPRRPDRGHPGSKEARIAGSGASE